VIQMTTDVKDVAIYYDASKCTACKGCQVACKQWNQLPSALSTEGVKFNDSFEYPPNNSGDTWLHIGFDEGEDSNGDFRWAFGRTSCQHCTDAACVSVCPSGACHKTPQGAVVIDKEICIGCQYCVAACPFGVPKFRERDNKTRKCWMCLDRIENGKRPACVSTCPTGALDFGDRYELIARAKARVEEIKPNKPDAVVYGIKEMGGLHVIQVLPFGPGAVGLPENPKVSNLTLASKYMKPFAGIGALAVAGFAALSWIRGRGYERGPEDLSYDPKTGITYDKGVPVDYDKPLAKDDTVDASAEASEQERGGE